MTTSEVVRTSIKEYNTTAKGMYVVVACIYLTFVGYVANRFGLPSLSILLAPLPLLAFKFDTFQFLVYYIAVDLLFFEASHIGSVFHFLQPADSCLFVFIVLYFIKYHNRFSVTIPINSILVMLYLFIFYVFIMAINPWLTKGNDHWLLFDLKKYVVLATAAFFCSQPIFGPKKIVYILLAFVIFTNIYGLITVINFLYSNDRQICWNEIYFGNMFIVSIVLITILRNKTARICLGICVFISGAAILATQTRSIWLSTPVCTLVYLAFFFRRIIHSIDSKKLTRAAVVLLLSFLVIEILMKVTVHSDLIAFVMERMAKFQNNELVDPFSSLGYRMFESYNVWIHRTFWGHGTGAYLYLFMTQLQDKKFTYWWSIHSEYMEVLHKWGFFGLGLYCLFLAVFLFKGLQLFFSRNKFIAAMGAVVFFTVLNTIIISLTSGYMIRVNMLIWDIIMIGIITHYGKRRKRSKSPKAALKTDKSSGVITV